MQVCFLIKILPRETWMVFKKLGIAVRVFVGQIGTEGVGVVPAPDRGVALVHDDSRGVEMIGVDEVSQDRTGGGGFPDYGDRNIF